MNKREFLAKLEKALSRLNREERKRQLDYYEEIINDRIEEGMSEEEAVHRMGTVQGVAAKILSEAAPEQMKKKRKIGVLGWIGIALAAIVLITAALVILFAVDRVEDSGMIPDLEDMIEERMEIEDGWILGSADAKLDVNEVSAVDIDWLSGDVIIDETEGRSIVINAGDAEALEYQIINGTLFIGNTESYAGNADLRVLIPEDIGLLNILNVAAAGGDIRVEGELFANINVAAADGSVRINPENAEYVTAAAAGGDVVVELDEDDAFFMNYAVDGGDVSVDFDRGFVNKSGNGESASYDHSLGRANCLNLDLSAAGGDIKLIDD